MGKPNAGEDTLGPVSKAASVLFYGNGLSPYQSLVSLVAKSVKNLPAMQETQVQSLGWEDLLEKEMATHCSVLAWKISWTEEHARLQSMGPQRVRHD